MKSQRVLGLAAAVAVAITWAAPAHAYIDGGTGSLFVQAAVSGLLGAIFVFRSSLTNLLSAFRRKSKSEGVEGG